MGRFRKNKGRNRYCNKNKDNISNGDNISTNEEGAAEGNQDATTPSGVPTLSTVQPRPQTELWMNTKRKLNTFEQEGILKYLIRYKEMAEELQQAGSISWDSKEGQSKESTQKDATDISISSHGNHNDENGNGSSSGAIDIDVENIGVHTFPALKPEFLSLRPYLMLPGSLTSKERRCIHSLAVEAELYHESVGIRGAQRIAVVSPFPKGLDQLVQDGHLTRPTNVPIRACQPWFYTSHNATLEQYTLEMDLAIATATSNLENDENNVLGNDMEFMLHQHAIDMSGDSSSEDEKNDTNNDIKVKDDKSASDSGGTDGHDFGLNECTPTNSSHWDRICNWHFSQKRTVLTIQRLNNSKKTVDDETEHQEENGQATSNIGKADGEAKAEDTDYVTTLTQRGKERVWALLDQPSACISDSEEFDFKSISEDDLSTMVPHTIDDFPCLLVDTVETMTQCLQELEETKPDVLGFDMEMYNLSEFTCLTCLIQLSTEEKNYVIDVLSPGVWDMVPLLAPIFADPSVVKVGQSIGSMDVPSLHRDFGIFMVNAFDTYEAARKLRLSRVGLKDICEAYGLSADRSLEYKTLKAHYQTCDWRTRPLSEDMIRYGRFDVHYLIALRKLMIRDLAQGDLWDTASEREGIDKDAEAELVSKALRAMIRRGGHDDDYGDEADFPSDMEDFNSIAASVPESEYFTSEETEDDDNGKNGNNKTEEPKITTASELRMCGSLMFVISQSQQRCLRMWKSKTEVIRVPKNHAFATIHAKQMKEAGQSNLDSFLCEKIVEWRRNVAKVAGTMPGLVCSTDLLIAIVQKRPKSHSELKRLQFFLPELLQNEESPYVESLIHTIRNFKATALHAGATKDAADAKDPDALMEPVNNDPSMEFHKVPRESHVREDMNDSNDEEHAHLRMKYLTIAVCVSAVAASIAIIMVRKRKR